MKTTEILSCGIKYWGLNGQIKFSAQHWRLC